MPTPRPLLVLLVLAAACANRDKPAMASDSTAPVGTTPVAPSLTVGPEGVGLVRVGSTLAQLNAAIGETIRPVFDVNDQCASVHPAQLPAGVTVMIDADTVARIDVDTTGVLTAEGAGVGDAEAKVLELYAGRISVEPHKYTGPEGHYLVVRFPADSMVRLIFETDGKKVLSYRAGRRPAVEYVEGCA